MTDKQSFFELLKSNWSLDEKFPDNWHMKTLCDHLEKIAEMNPTSLKINLKINLDETKHERLVRLLQRLSYHVLKLSIKNKNIKIQNEEQND